MVADLTFPIRGTLWSKNVNDVGCCPCRVSRCPFMWRGLVSRDLVLWIEPVSLVCAVWVSHWWQANAKWQTRAYVIFGTLGGLDYQGLEQIKARGFLFVFCFCQFFSLPPSFLPSFRLSSLPFLLSVLLIFSPVFLSFSFSFSLSFCPLHPSLFPSSHPFKLVVLSGAAIAVGWMYLLFSEHLLAVKSWLLEWFLQPHSVQHRNCLAVWGEPRLGVWLSWARWKDGFWASLALVAASSLCALITCVFSCFCKPQRSGI